MPTKLDQKIEQYIENYKAQKPKRTGSFIITLFGDLMPIKRDGMWLQDVIEILAPFGISAGLVRTSMTRLVQDGWLCRNQVGRNAVYDFAQNSKKDAKTAADKIYQINPAKWQGDFQQLILLANADQSRSERDATKRHLSDLGFVHMQDQIFAKPNYSGLLKQADLEKDLGTNFILSNHVAYENAEEIFELADLQFAYEQFYQKYHPIVDLLSEDTMSKADPMQLLNLRLLLIHDYRKICLKDPLLPQSLIKQAWLGYKCQNLVKQIYLKLAPNVRELLNERNIILSAPHDARFK